MSKRTGKTDGYFTGRLHNQMGGKPIIPLESSPYLYQGTKAILAQMTGQDWKEEEIPSINGEPPYEALTLSMHLPMYMSVNLNAILDKVNTILDERDIIGPHIKLERVTYPMKVDGEPALGIKITVPLNQKREADALARDMVENEEAITMDLRILSTANASTFKSPPSGRFS